MSHDKHLLMTGGTKNGKMNFMPAESGWRKSYWIFPVNRASPDVVVSGSAIGVYGHRSDVNGG